MMETWAREEEQTTNTKATISGSGRVEEEGESSESENEDNSHIPDTAREDGAVNDNIEKAN